MGRVRYVHQRNDEDYRTMKDRFIFQLSDGTNVASHDACEIEIVAAQSSAVTVWNRGLTVHKGSTSVLTVDVLNAVGVDGTTAPSRLVYRVISPPKLGYLGLNNETDQSIVVMPVSEFTQADLDARRVFYAQTIKATGTDVTDSFRFQLLDAGGVSPLAEGEFQIAVKRVVERAAAVLSLDVNVPVTVIEGYRTPLTADNLHAVFTQSGTSEESVSDVVYSLVEPPRHGQLLRSGVEVADTFSQSDIDSGRIEYRSDGSDSSMMDYFLFTIFPATDFNNHDDSSSSTLDTTSSPKPLFFSILIQPVTKIPPTVVRVRKPERLVSLGSGRFGFLLTSLDLKATHPLFDSRDVLYQLRTRPLHGYLEHLGSRRPIRRKFSQKDIDDKKIAFVLNEQTHATNDSFTFRVLDLNRNYVDNLRYSVIINIFDQGRKRNFGLKVGVPIQNEKRGALWSILQRQEGRFTKILPSIYQDGNYYPPPLSTGEARDIATRSSVRPCVQKDN